MAPSQMPFRHGPVELCKPAVGPRVQLDDEVQTIRNPEAHGSEAGSKRDDDRATPRGT